MKLYISNNCEAWTSDLHVTNCTVTHLTEKHHIPQGITDDPVFGLCRFPCRICDYDVHPETSGAEFNAKDR